MSRIKTGWRLAKDSWAVLRADRSLAIFPALSTAFTAVALALLLTPGLVGSAATGKDWVVLPFLVVAGYAATFFTVYFNVALARAARLSMDGRDTTVADGLAGARERRGLIAKWAVIQFAVGLLISGVHALLGDSAAGRGVAAIGSGLVSIAGAAWPLATFFVIPVLALEGLGPGEAMRRSVSLIRERWGEALVGSASIGLAVFVVAVLPLAGLLNLTLAVIDIAPAVGAGVGVVWIVALIATLALGSALGVLFRVGLYRYSTEGHVTDGFAQQDMVAAFPSRPA